MLSSIRISGILIEAPAMPSGLTTFQIERLAELFEAEDVHPEILHLYSMAYELSMNWDEFFNAVESMSVDVAIKFSRATKMVKQIFDYPWNGVFPRDPLKYLTEDCAIFRQEEHPELHARACILTVHQIKRLNRLFESARLFKSIYSGDVCRYISTPDNLERGKKIVQYVLDTPDIDHQNDPVDPASALCGGNVETCIELMIRLGSSFEDDISN